MKIAMISFTGNGRRLERSLAHELEKEGHQVLQAVKCKELESDKDAVKCSAREWTGSGYNIVLSHPVPVPPDLLSLIL